MGAVEPGIDRREVLEAIVAPETVRRACRDDEEVIGLARRRTIWSFDRHVLRSEVDTGDAALHEPHSIEPAEASVGDEVGASPLGRVGQPPAEFLAAHERGSGGDAHDVTAARETGGDERTGVAEPGDHDARTALGFPHARRLDRPTRHPLSR